MAETGSAWKAGCITKGMHSVYRSDRLLAVRCGIRITIIQNCEFLSCPRKGSLQHVIDMVDIQVIRGIRIKSLDRLFPQLGPDEDKGHPSNKVVDRARPGALRRGRCDPGRFRDSSGDQDRHHDDHQNQRKRKRCQLLCVFPHNPYPSYYAQGFLRQSIRFLCILSINHRFFLSTSLMDKNIFQMDESGLFS